MPSEPASLGFQNILSPRRDGFGMASSSDLTSGAHVTAVVSIVFERSQLERRRYARNANSCGQEQSIL
jgi:hypothetical protein